MEPRIEAYSVHRWTDLKFSYLVEKSYWKLYDGLNIWIITFNMKFWPTDKILADKSADNLDFQQKFAHRYIFRNPKYYSQWTISQYFLISRNDNFPIFSEITKRQFPNILWYHETTISQYFMKLRNDNFPMLKNNQFRSTTLCKKITRLIISLNSKIA